MGTPAGCTRRMAKSTWRSLPEHVTRVGVCALAIGAILLAGCQRALFPDDTPRTQFEMQDRMRGHHVPLEEPVLPCCPLTRTTAIAEFRRSNWLYVSDYVNQPSSGPK